MLERGSVTPGMEGIRGGSERALADVTSTADKSAFESILTNRRETGEDPRAFAQVLRWLLFLPCPTSPYL